MVNQFKSSLRFYCQLLKTSFKQAVAVKSAFCLRVIFMIINNLMMLFAWGALFHQFNTINGWTFYDFMFMTGLCVGSFSIWSLFFRGMGIYMARLIEYGDLDTYLTQPRTALFHISCSISDPSGLGDFITGLLLMTASGLLTWQTAPIVLTCFICATICFLSVNILVSSLPFFFRKTDDLSERLFYLFFNIAGYPGSIYNGLAKLLLCTLFPVGIISVFPVLLLQTFSIWILIYIVLFSVGFLSISIFFFQRGLRRYEGGNRFGIHGQ